MKLKLNRSLTIIFVMIVLLWCSVPSYAFTSVGEQPGLETDSQIINDSSVKVLPKESDSMKIVEEVVSRREEYISDHLNDMLEDSNERCVFWTNRDDSTYCFGTEMHILVPEGSLAFVYNSSHSVHFFTIYGNNDNEKKAYMSINLVHETSHTFGFPDVYGISHDGVYGMQCVMEYYNPYDAYRFYTDILRGYSSPFCSSCATSIKYNALNAIAD